MKLPLIIAVLLSGLMIAAAPEPAPTDAARATRFLDAPHRAQAISIITKAEGYLRSHQDPATGGWSVPTQPDASKPMPPHFPAITALIVKGLLMNPAADPVKDPVLANAIDYILRFRQPDGGIYDKLLPSYNTSLSLSALARANTPKAREAIKPAQDFLRKLQWGESADASFKNPDSSKPVGKENVYYGGVGYGNHGRPDNSNLSAFMQAMEDSGVSPQDPAVQRALEFLRRTQMDDRVNDMPYAKGSRQGGFIYSTNESAESVEGRAGQSYAGTVEETLSDGTKASRLRAYGTMTYAGFKSYLYAELPKDDVRVQAAYGWICRNYSVDENPGIGASGQYYYYLLFGRAMGAWGQPTVKLMDENNQATGQERHWAEDLVDKLAALQNPDGSFKSVDKRWMESNPDLITAYALIGLRYASE